MCRRCLVYNVIGENGPLEQSINSSQIICLIGKEGMYNSVDLLFKTVIDLIQEGISHNNLDLLSLSLSLVPALRLPWIYVIRVRAFIRQTPEDGRDGATTLGTVHASASLASGGCARPVVEHTHGARTRHAITHVQTRQGHAERHIVPTDHAHRSCCREPVCRVAVPSRPDTSPKCR